MAILDERSLEWHAPEPVTAGVTAGQDPDAVADYPVGALEGALRIGAALRAAHQDSIEVQSAEAPEHGWNWIVKSSPGPDFVVMTTEALDRDDLLANDSLGG